MIVTEKYITIRAVRLVYIVNCLMHIKIVDFRFAKLHIYFELYIKSSKVNFNITIIKKNEIIDIMIILKLLINDLHFFNSLSFNMFVFFSLFNLSYIYPILFLYIIFS
jgi:hypothetical protein